MKMQKYFKIILLLIPVFMICGSGTGMAQTQKIDDKIENILRKMTLREKIGQMSQFNGFNGEIPGEFKEKLKAGLVGSVLNEVNTATLNELQRIAVEESRLGIPLLIGRDVIHGFKTIFPIPLGQAASFNPELVEQGARIAATEAASTGINWTFAPMIDITRDPRWGRIAESLGEDPFLASVLGSAMVRGFQGEQLSDKTSIAACAKHFAGYGAAEGGRDYNTASIPENELRDVYLKPFHAAVENEVATIMSAFNEVNGVPATGSEFLLQQVLRKEWQFGGFVVSDWESVIQQTVHGFTPDSKAAALQAIRAGVDMEMASTTYADHVEELLKEGSLNEEMLNSAVRRILKLKFELGLFENPYTDPQQFPEILNSNHKAVAQKIATQSLVLLKNENTVLPVSRKIKSVAVIGPLADSPHDQMGTWVFDGEKKHSVTPLQAIRDLYGNKIKINFAKGLEISRTTETSGFADAVTAAENSDIVLLFLGEESILSGESHCRANIDLPGAQEQLVAAISETKKPVVAVIMAGRPLTFRNILPQIDALIYAWHPGTMGGPAIADVLFGKYAPSGKLPVTFPTVVGQIPMYYAHKKTGKPATDQTWERMDDIPVEAFQLSIGNTTHYLDEGFEPLYHFGFGLSYTEFEYSDISAAVGPESVKLTALVKNTGDYDGDEVVQLYIRDLFADRTRPVRELKGFQRISLKKGQQQQVNFEIPFEDLAFHNRQMQLVTEPGKFHAWIGGDSRANLMCEFEIKSVNK